MEVKLEKRIQRIEDEMQGKVHSILKGMLQAERNPTKRSSRNSSLSIRRFWGKRGKMETKKGES